MPAARPAADRDSDSDSDLGLVRRAGRRAAVQAALLVAVSFALCAALVLLVVLAAQGRAADDQLRAAAVRAEDVSDPPEGVGLLLRHPDGRIDLSAGAPAALPERSALSAVLAGGPAALVTDVRADGGQFRVRTQRRATPAGVLVVQAALSLRSQHAERRRLLAALAAGAGLALLAAVGLGMVTGRRAAHQLVAVLGRQRRFVADASHELRTPVTVLATRAQLLRRHLQAAALGERERRLLTEDADRLSTDSARLGELIEDLLAASEPSSAGGQCTDLAAIAAEVAASLEPLAAGSGVRLVLTRPDADAGGAAPGRAVRGSDPAIRRSLVALVDNAVRHTPPGGTVTVTVDIARQTGRVMVADTGLGIGDAVRGRVFDRFFSGDRTAEDTAGAGSGRRYGLGLALVADTAHRFGGSIAVDSGPGGTRFTLELPRWQQEPAGRSRRWSRWSRRWPGARRRRL